MERTRTPFEPVRLLLPLLAVVLASCTTGAQTMERPSAAAAVGEARPATWGVPVSSVTPSFATGGMVSTTDQVASEIGAEILRRGGNAVDAAIATHFALAVVNPEAGNIGGGGFMVVRLTDGTTASLDFREAAPSAATRDMFLDEEGNVTDLSLVGHLAAGVPGSVAGMWEAHRRFGSLPWAELVRPAVNLAEGIVVHERLAQSLQSAESRLQEFPATAEAFLIDGRAPRVGDRFEQPDLARTLERVASEGRDGFYRGETARLVEEEMRRGGGLITAADLAAYEARWRDPVVFEYRGHTVISMPPPSSGGATLAQILNILEGYDLQRIGYHTPEHVHLFTEATRRAYADRNAYLADPDFVPQPTVRMSSDEYAATRRADIRMARATPSEQVDPGLGPTVEGAPVEESEHTTHYSIIDGDGNAVAVTTTINSLYGNRVTVAGAGFLLNNEMDDFTSKPGVPNQFGLVQGAANAVAPGKRMLSAMTPTIVLDPQGEVKLVTGSPGGSTIITTVAQMVSNVVDFGMNAAEATAAVRLHHQHLPDVLRYEHDGLPDEVVAALRAMGHEVEERSGYQGDTQSLMLLDDGTISGAADPRRGGAAVGVRTVRTVVQ